MASMDKEVLIKGTISGAAITGVTGVEQAVKEMSLDARKNLLEEGYRYGPRPKHEGPEQEEWDRMFQKNVPEGLREHFGHVTEEQLDEEPTPKARVKRQASSSPEPARKPGGRPKKKPKVRLSFMQDDD